jgi:hypothetical protein
VRDRSLTYILNSTPCIYTNTRIRI